MNQPINAGPFWDNASLCPDARYVKAIGEAPSSPAAGLPRLETHQLLPENSLLSLQTHFGPEPEETEQPRPRGPTQSQSGSFPGTGYAGPRGHKRGSDTDPPTHSRNPSSISSSLTLVASKPQGTTWHPALVA